MVDWGRDKPAGSVKSGGNRGQSREIISRKQGGGNEPRRLKVSGGKKKRRLICLGKRSQIKGELEFQGGGTARKKTGAHMKVKVPSCVKRERQKKNNGKLRKKTTEERGRKR